jgi:hypothetical protein
MTTINVNHSALKAKLSAFLEGDVTLLNNGTINGYSVTYQAIDHTRDNVNTIVIIELHDEMYSVEMMINNTMRDLGMFEFNTEGNE